MNKLVIIGAGGFGREVAWLVERINNAKPTWELLGFIENTPDLQGSVIGGYPVIGDDTWLKKNSNDLYAVCAIGTAETRKKIIEKYDDVKFATLIDPSVILSNKITLGDSCIICAGSILTVDITIGSHVIINLDCTIGHDAVLKDFVTLYPSVNISGKAIIGECVELGTGSQIIQGLTVGDHTIIGAASVVVKDIPAHCTAVGCPAVPIP